MFNQDFVRAKACPFDYRFRLQPAGDCEVKIFKGPNARQRARQYAEQRYGNFEEIRLAP